MSSIDERQMAIDITVIPYISRDVQQATEPIDY